MRVNLLSEDDKTNLKLIFEELEMITLPTTFQNTGGQGHSKRIGALDQKGARHTSWGITLYQGKKKVSRYTNLHPHMLPLFDKFIQHHMPDFKYTSVYVNRNVRAKAHYDKVNINESLIVGCGNYTGGDLVVEGSHFNIKDNSVIFNASEMLHSNDAWEGIRYSLVFFSIQ